MAVEATNETESAAESQELDREVLLTVYRRRPRGVAGEEAQGEQNHFYTHMHDSHGPACFGWIRALGVGDCCHDGHGHVERVAVERVDPRCHFLAFILYLAIDAHLPNGTSQ